MVKIRKPLVRRNAISFDNDLNNVECSSFEEYYEEPCILHNCLNFIISLFCC